MSASPETRAERRKSLAVWTVVGAVVGAVVGGFGFSEAGINIAAALIGLLAGAAGMAILTLLVTETFEKGPPWLPVLLAGAFFGWLFAGVIWEQQFERKMSAQLTGLVIGLGFTLLLLSRD